MHGENMSVPYRPLGLVKEMLEQMGVEVSYAYDDLVFMEHNYFLLQFGEVGEALYFYANRETVDSDVQSSFTQIQAVARAQGIILQHRGSYRISAGDNENLALELFEETSCPQEGE